MTIRSVTDGRKYADSERTTFALPRQPCLRHGTVLDTRRLLILRADWIPCAECWFASPHGRSRTLRSPVPRPASVYDPAAGGWPGPCPSVELEAFPVDWIDRNGAQGTGLEWTLRDPGPACPPLTPAGVPL
jgi:hypothetical protein